MKDSKLNLSLALKGAAMGIAEVIPGVSGGTIAFITGIYEQLLNSIKAFHPSLIGTFKEEGFGAVWEKINGTFLVNLLVGMAAGVIVGIFGITYLIENYPVLVWAFFFGLIVASAIYIAKQIRIWGAAEFILLVAGIAIAFSITIISPAEGTTALWFVFLSGMIAISALILPGISGSFILLLMGMYTVVIPHIKKALTLQTDSIIIAATFALGCLVGLFSFANILSWTFKHFKTQTLALLTGFMIGSLNKIWPWRETVKWVSEDGKFITDKALAASLEKVKIVEETNVLPAAYDGEPYTLLVIVLAILGFASVFLIEKMGKK